jgi:hypothetical protein
MPSVNPCPRECCPRPDRLAVLNDVVHVDRHPEAHLGQLEIAKGSMPRLPEAPGEKQPCSTSVWRLTALEGRRSRQGGLNAPSGPSLTSPPTPRHLSHRRRRPVTYVLGSGSLGRTAERPFPRFLERRMPVLGCRHARRRCCCFPSPSWSRLSASRGPGFS